jgi:hypothetical protein
MRDMTDRAAWREQLRADALRAVRRGYDAGMTYALLLNDMRSPNIENIEVVRTAETPRELAGWYMDQLADEPWKDGQWRKAFKPGSDLEWFNPAADIRMLNDYFGGIWEVPDGTPVGTGLCKA